MAHDTEVGPIRQEAIQWAVDIANDDSIGYSQENRYDTFYDCTSLVYYAYYYGSIRAGKSFGWPHGAPTYTENMETTSWPTYFDEFSVEEGTYGELIPGDVLMRKNAEGGGHACMYIGSGNWSGTWVAAHGTNGRALADQINTYVDNVNRYYHLFRVKDGVDPAGVYIDHIDKVVF